MSESNTSATLVQIQRDHLRAYVSSQLGPTPWWYWPTMGGAIGVMVGVNYMASTAVSLLFVLPLVVVTGLAGRVRIARRGSVPRFRGMPAPLRGVLVGQSATTGLLVGGAILITESLNAPVLQLISLSALTAASMGISGWYFERQYRAEAERLADGAGIDR